MEKGLEKNCGVIILANDSKSFDNVVKKTLKKPKGHPEAVNRRTDNTMAKVKKTKEQTTQWPK